MSSLVRDGIRLESPLAGLARHRGLLRYRETVVSERPFLAHVNVRGDPADPSFVSDASTVLGFELPRVANTVRESEGRLACWMGPDEWLIVSMHDDERQIARGLRQALRDRHASVVELGGGQTMLHLEGKQAGELLARGCPLDLHERAFATGQCAQSHIAKAPALLIARDNAIDVVVRRSFADYLWRWLMAIVDVVAPQVEAESRPQGE